MVDSIVLSSRKMAGFYLNLKVGVVVNNETIYIESNGKDNFTYKYLLKELFTRYPTMHLQTLKIYWIDPEGDEINITNKKDMIYFRNKQPESGRIYVEQESAMSKLQNYLTKVNLNDPKSKTLHMVVCNKCDKIIEHHRYNCIQCLDYDLCMECESKFIHEDHLMLRISAKNKFALDKNLKNDIKALILNKIENNK